MKVKRTVIIVAIIIAAAAAALYFFVFKPGASDVDSAASLYVPGERGVAVETAEAEYGLIIPSIKASGLVRGKKEAVLISETRGIVKEVYKKIGDRVEEGEAILSVDSDIAELSMLQAEQQLQSSRIDYESVKRAYDRGGASEAEMLGARSRLAGAEAQYKNAVNRYENSVIKAPYAGFLADIESSAGIGNYISEGTRIGHVIDLSGIKVDLFLGDDEVSRIENNASVLIETGGRVLEGQVEAIALTSDRSTGSFRVVVSAENPYGTAVRSGFAADVSITQLNTEEHVIVPASSIFELNGESYVYVIEEEKALLRRIKAGSISGNRREVLEGLDAGEIIASSGFKSLKDDAKVITRYAAEEGGGE